ncbi:hypothetical protein [Spiroplasma endosymbiont of Lasioglossum malachurum]|uniref:hypothetical protein n=1 Tax=Spiroplasma endosymbiont of Lasioglossum malachurum TaxID=3066319 RepID=UPI0030D617C1
MNKQKLFSYKDQEIINEYNKKRNQEITEEHLNNIEKLREDFKKEVINEYKEKLISWLKIREKEYRKCIENNNNYKGRYEIICVLLYEINNGYFD